MPFFLAAYSLRSNDGKRLDIPSCKSLSTLGDGSFYMAAPKLWNDLPLFIRNISSVNAFEKALKTHLIISESVSQLIYWFHSLYKVEGFVNRILKNNWSLFLKF